MENNMSLGFISSAQKHTVAKAQDISLQVEVPEPPPPRHSMFFITHSAVDLLKSTLFGGLFLAASYMFLDNELDRNYTDRDARIATISLVSAAGLFCLLCTSTTSAFNTFLGYYIGLETFLIERAFRVGSDSTNDSMLRGWSWAAGFTIIVHLLPFLLINKSCFLYVLAYVGLMVNVITILYIIPSLGGQLLLLYAASGSALIVSTINKTSLSYGQLLKNFINLLL